MTKDTLLRMLVLLYVVGVVVTFGHAMSYLHSRDEEQQLFGAMFSSLAWPFYWSAWFWAH